MVTNTDCLFFVVDLSLKNVLNIAFMCIYNTNIKINNKTRKDEVKKKERNVKCHCPIIKL